MDSNPLLPFVKNFIHEKLKSLSDENLLRSSPISFFYRYEKEAKDYPVKKSYFNNLFCKERDRIIWQRSDTDLSFSQWRRKKQKQNPRKVQPPVKPKNWKEKKTSFREKIRFCLNELSPKKILKLKPKQVADMMLKKGLIGELNHSNYCNITQFLVHARAVAEVKVELEREQERTRLLEAKINQKTTTDKGQDRVLIDLVFETFELCRGDAEATKAKITEQISSQVDWVKRIGNVMKL